MTPNKKKSGRRKKQKVTSDTDGSDYESSNVKKSKFNNDNVVTSTLEPEPQVQGVWGEHIPHNILYKIFQNVCFQEGSLPSLVRSLIEI